jgi:N-methylhydantoinase A
VAARIGIDTGGTFTDVVRLDGRTATVHKLPSTPDDPGRAVVAGLAAVRRHPDEPVDLVHGTTVGLNAVLTGNLARTVLVTNAGLEDVVEIGRQDRDDLYALAPTRHSPPVPRERRVGVACRRDADGKVVLALSRAEIARTVAAVVRLRPAAVAVGLVHAPVEPRDELALAAAIRRRLPDVPVTTSAALAPVAGEYERFCAAILDAAIAPVVGRYTTRLAAAIGAGRLRLLRSSLGAMPPAEAAAFPSRAMFSGPAGGVLAAEQLARATGHPAVAAFDMGGTSADLCLVVPGQTRDEVGTIAGLPLPIPTVPVHTVGCGGGSVAYADAGGALRVGPRSAGAVPGPACYGLGDEPTVTDAHLALGHLGPHTLLGGRFPIDVDAAVRAIERLGRRLSLDARRTALGILAVANATMARAALVVTAERAIDPRHVPLVAYGGAGGLHAAALVAHLGMPVALLPRDPGAFSALGLALAGESVELARACRHGTHAGDLRQLQQYARALRDAARAQLGARGRCRVEALVRYAGQGQALRLPFGPRLAAAFAHEHQRRFGFVVDAPLEVTQLVARAETAPRALPTQRRGLDRQDPAATGTRRSPLGGRRLRVCQRADLALGDTVPGPAAIEEGTATTLVPAGWVASVQEFTLELREIP